MMLRKLLAVTLLSFASTILLAFTVLPHHHHQEYICFAASHCTDETEQAQHSHDNGPLKDTHQCINNLLKTQISKIQNLSHSCQEGHCHHFILIPFLVPDLLALISLEASQPLSPNLTYREKLHAICPSSPLAGRAPPFIG